MLCQSAAVIVTITESPHRYPFYILLGISNLKFHMLSSLIEQRIFVKQLKQSSPYLVYYANNMNGGIVHSTTVSLNSFLGSLENLK